MKLLYRILFFLLAIFYIYISEAKVLVFEAVVSETNIPATARIPSRGSINIINFSH